MSQEPKNINELKRADSWKFTGRVAIHFVLTVVVVLLSCIVVSAEYAHLCAYIPPFELMPIVAVLALIVCCTFPFARINGRNLHLLMNLAIAIFLFRTSLIAWKDLFEKSSADLMAVWLSLLSLTTLATTCAAWILRRERKSVSLLQLAGSVTCVALVLAMTQHVLKFNEFDNYTRERTAVQELRECGASLNFEDWSVTSVAIRNSGVTDKQLSRISEFPKLKSLSLEGNPVSDQTLATIANVTKLQSVQLNDTDVGDDGLKHLASAFKIRELYLGGTNVTDDGIDHLKSLFRIRVLDLRDTAISDDGLKGLTHMKQMYYLHLPGTNVTKAGMDELAKSLPNCRLYGTPDGKSYQIP